MKVAIMGAGLSGLACAITLENHGIIPTIYEKRDQIGDRFVNGEALLSILSRPITDCIAYLSENHGIYLHPVAHMQKLIIQSKHEKAIMEGQLGFINIRGREQDSFETQLSTQLKTEVLFNSQATYEQLLQEYTHVIIATGDSAYAKKLHNFREDLTVTIRGATVEGEFDRYTAMTWLDHDFAPKGYGYLLPYSEKEANINITYPDYPENQVLHMDELWNKFYSRACLDLNQHLHITDQFQITNYGIGICQTPRIGNTFFTGNCFGSIMPILGFGQLTALLTGIYAAHDLCGLGNYEDLTKSLRQSYKNSLVLRKAVERQDNHDLDRIVKFLSGPWGNKLLTTKQNPLKVASYLLRPLVSLTKN